VYDEFYGLNAKPFQLTPDRRFFFDSRGHHRALAYLRYGLEQGEGFIVITGSIGSGKTILVRTLFSELESHDIVAAQLVTTQVGPEDMLRMVSASFGLAHERTEKATMLRNLEATARQRFAEGKRILLIVDEAQNLPASSIEELRMLANFQVEGRSLFQSFLLGQDELRRTLRGSGMEQMRQRIIASYHLEPLSAEETRAYVEHRLQRVGWNADPELEEPLFEGIHAFTGGVPRRINTLCDRLFLYGCLEEKHRLDESDLDVVLTEMRGEVAHAPRRVMEAGGSEDTEDTEQLSPEGALDPTSQRDLSRRLAELEAEVARLRQIVNNERKLLRKAVLLQLDLEAYDDLD
jgi:putative secretion ATPase (PEP-CTERM system associated)